MDWDDLKVVLALHRKGSARGAAQLLGVSNSTITRRLDEVEGSLKTRLFDRTPDGYRLTVHGEQLLPTAEHVEELLSTAELRITGGDQEFEGSVRITMPNVSGMRFLFQRLAGFAEEYPAINLELEASNEALDLSRREADIAIRVMRVGLKPPEYLIGRHLTALSASAYVHQDLLNPDDPGDVSHLTWIGKQGEGQKEEWLVDVDFPTLPIRHAIIDIGLIVEAVRAQMGMAYMPCFAALNTPGLVRVPGARIIHHSDMWVLTHKDLRLSARMRYVRDLIAQSFEGIKSQLDTRDSE